VEIMRNDCLVCKTRGIGNGMDHQWRQQWLRDRTNRLSADMQSFERQISRITALPALQFATIRLALTCALVRSAAPGLTSERQLTVLPPLLYSSAASTIDKPGCSLLRQVVLCPQQLLEVHFVPAAALRMGSFEHGQTSLLRQAVLCPQQLVEVHFVPVVAVCQLHLHARLRRPVRLQK
jgi:hypothetical protein